MELQITGSMTEEFNTVKINRGKCYEILKDHQKLQAKKYFNKFSVSIDERAKKEYVC